MFRPRELCSISPRFRLTSQTDTTMTHNDNYNYFGEAFATQTDEPTTLYGYDLQGNMSIIFSAQQQ